MRRIFVATVAALALGGCSSKTAESPRPSTSPSPTAVVAARYASTQDLVSALNQKKVWCSAYEDRANLIDAIQMGSCFNGEDELVISLFEDEAEASKAANEVALALDELAAEFDLEESTEEFIIGPNWLINCGSWSLGCAQIVKAIGGRYTSL